MAKGSSKPLPQYVTVLEREPNYLMAIGTLSVEIVNVEVMLSYLLAAISRLPVRAADAMYFGPQAIGARIPIVAGAAEECLIGYPDYLKEARRCFTDARKVSIKRNEIMHHAWGISSEDGRVTSRRLPFTEDNPPRHTPISEIENVIHSTRILLNRIRRLALTIGNDETYSPWPSTPPAQARAENSDRPEALPKELQDPPPSSLA